MRSDNFLATKLVLMLLAITLVARLFLAPATFPPSPDLFSAEALKRVSERMGDDLWTPYQFSGMPLFASMAYHNNYDFIRWAWPMLIGFILVFASLMVDGYNRWVALGLSFPILYFCSIMTGDPLNVFGMAIIVFLVNHRKLGLWE